MSQKSININFFNTTASNLNTQKNPKCRSNSLLHRKETANKEYKNRISLSPLGELKMDIRDQIPTYHINDVILKTNYLNELDEIKAFDKANIQTDINSQAKKQKYQLLLEKDSNINKLCRAKSNEIKFQFENRKKNLQDQLTSIIKDSLLFAKKNSPVAAMLPPGMMEFFEKMKDEKEDNSINLSFSNKSTRSKSAQKDSKLRNNKNKFIKKTKNEFLSLIGVDVDNLSPNNVNIDIDKAWNFVLTWAKGRNVDEILRYKVVNSIMSLTEQKASEKARKMYLKIEKYKEYKKKERLAKIRKKKEEERKRKEELKKMNPSDLIKSRMKASLSEIKSFNKEGFSLTSRPKMKKKKFKNEEEPIKREIIKLNAYNDVDEIIRFIDNSKKNSQSKLNKDHFTNIKRTKIMDEKLKRLMKKNLIVERK
jgi:hypothetical protein